MFVPFVCSISYMITVFRTLVPYRESLSTLHIVLENLQRLAVKSLNSQQVFEGDFSHILVHFCAIITS